MKITKIRERWNLRLNPIYKQETRVSSRSFRLPLIILLCNTVLAVVALLNMYSMITQVQRTAEIQYSSFVGLYIFVALVEFVLLLFLVPALTAGAISGERERQTLNMLMTTHLTPWDIVLGKLGASLSNILLMIVSSFPILALGFIYGGVMWKDIVLLVVCYCVTAILLGCIGICCSSVFSKSTVATVVSYCVMAVLVLGTVAVNHLAAAFQRVVSVSSADSGACLYLLLFNPAASFPAALESQLGGYEELGFVFSWVAAAPENLITEHWLIFALAAQALLAALFLWIAVRCVEPHRRKRTLQTRRSGG